MADKLGIGSTLPSFTLNLVDGGEAVVPKENPEGYQIILFYRGHW